MNGAILACLGELYTKWSQYTMKKLIFAIILSIFFTECLSAQEQKVWTLEECMQYAIQNSPRTKRQQYYNDNDRQNYISSVANMLPSISGGVGGYANFGRSPDPATNGYSNTSNFTNNYSVSASLPVFNGFTLINSLRSSKIALLLGKEAQQQVFDDISLSVMQCYFNVIYCIGSVAISQEKLQASQQNCYKISEFEKLGLRSSADVAQVEAQVATDDAGLINQQNSLTLAWTRLKNIMNYPLEDSLMIDTQISMIDDIPQESAGDLFAGAKQILPQAKIAQLELQRSKLSYAISKGYLYPSIYLSGGYSTRYYTPSSPDLPSSFRELFKNNRNTSISISLNIPIFNGLSRRTNVNRSQNNVHIQEENYQENLRQIQTQIKQAVDECQGLAKEYLQANKQVSATELAHKAVQRKFDEGLLSSIELQTSANQLQQARASMLNIKLNYIIQYRLIHYYKGIPLIEQVQ